MRRTSIAFAVLLVAFPAFLPGRAGAESSLWVSPTCTGGSAISLRISFLDDPAHPSALPPEWVGYDIYRRTFPNCGEWIGVRVNEEVLLRPPQGIHELTYVDTPANPGTHQYSVVFVDAERHPILLPSCYFCELGFGYHGALGYASCPAGQFPATIGRLEDWGWALYVQGCRDAGCWPSAYFSDEKWEAELRPYAGTDTVIRFYGSLECCSVEGTVMQIDRWEFAACGPTPTARSSWGQVKAIYR